VQITDGSTLLMDVPLSITVDEGDDFILPCRPTHRGATVDFKSYASKDRTEKHLSLIKVIETYVCCSPKTTCAPLCGG